MSPLPLTFLMQPRSLLARDAATRARVTHRAESRPSTKHRRLAAHLSYLYVHVVFLTFPGNRSLTFQIAPSACNPGISLQMSRNSITTKCLSCVETKVPGNTKKKTLDQILNFFFFSREKKNSTRQFSIFIYLSCVQHRFGRLSDSRQGNEGEKKKMHLISISSRSEVERCRHAGHFSRWVGGIIYRGGCGGGVGRDSEGIVWFQVEVSRSGEGEGRVCFFWMHMMSN